MSIELSPKEEAMIKAMRTADEIPDNFVLWYYYGITESAKKIKDIDSIQYEISMKRGNMLNSVYNKLTK